MKSIKSASHSVKATGSVLLAASLFILAACNDSGDPTSSRSSLTGNWGSGGANGGALSLVETNGTVSGFGWIGPSGIPVVANGTRDGKEVLLNLVIATRDQPIGIFRGEFDNEVLVGDFLSLYRASLTRVDVVASATAATTYAKDSPTFSDYASFFSSTEQLVIDLNTSRGPQIRILAPAKNLLPGKYPIGVAGTAPYSATMGGISMTESVSGELTITASSKRAINGSFVIKLANASVTYDVTGTFSAACTHDYVQPGRPGCMPAK